MKKKKRSREEGAPREAVLALASIIVYEDLLTSCAVMIRVQPVDRQVTSTRDLSPVDLALGQGKLRES